MAFPTSLDDSVSLPNPTAVSTTNSPSHAGIHTAENAAIIALETKLGTGASTATTGKVLKASGTGTSAWAQADLTTDVTGTLPVANGGTGATTVAAVATAVGALLYPVGSYYINETNSTNPATLLGFGTWAAVQDRTIVGKGSGTFATAGSTGGEETHILTTAEMPAHTHGSRSLTGNIVMHASASYTNIAGVSGVFSSGQTNGQYSSPPLVGNVTSIGVVNIDATHTHDSVGSGTAHNNLPPYIVAYIWKRTA